MRLRLLQFVAAAALVGVLVWSTKPWDLGDTLRDADPLPLVLVALLNLPVLAIIAFRSVLVLRRLGADLSYRSMLPLSVIGNVLGSLTPAASGDFVRAPFLKQLHGVSYDRGLAAIVYERAFSVAVLVVMTGLTAAWRVAPAGARPAFIAAGPIAAVLPALLAPAARRLGGPPGAPGGPAARWSIRARLGPGGMAIMRGLASLLADARLTAAFLLTSAAVVGLQGVQMWFAADSLGLSLSPGNAIVIIGASALAAVVSFLPLGAGSLDATMAALLAQTGASATSRAAIVVVVRATITLPLAAMALLSYLHVSRTPKREAAEVGG